ncbi:methyltransferase domain-containing protein [Bacillus sp. FJAT-27251]|uniref:class I SAM-dependent methyltransferase n=1 Tax=Bacillus sp. FJAT-27251 TaxID=1684142 RepID=UPI0006A7D94E|nr:methyltransferase domain-containing protein [Bacillus sp. FJAT-27251]
MDPRMKWNSKYKERLIQAELPKPNPRLASLVSGLNGGAALDLACGLGGNSLFLAEQGFEVDALDISDIAVSHVQEQAERLELPINARRADLTEWDNPAFLKESYDLIVITYYLDRTLFPLVKPLLKENGHFFMETFYQSPSMENGKVSNQFKLRPRELLSQFNEWKILHYEENEREGVQTLFCRKS